MLLLARPGPRASCNVFEVYRETLHCALSMNNSAHRTLAIHHHCVATLHMSGTRSIHDHLCQPPAIHRCGSLPLPCLLSGGMLPTRGGQTCSAHNSAHTQVGDWGRRGTYNQSLVAATMATVARRHASQFVISTGDNFCTCAVVPHTITTILHTCSDCPPAQIRTASTAPVMQSLTGVIDRCTTTAPSMCHGMRY